MKIAALITALALPTVALADGQFEGIWATSTGSYATVNQNGSSVVVTSLDASTLTFNAFQGVIVNNQATVYTVLAGANASMRITFTSETSATVTFLSCVPFPGYVCLIPNGTQISAQRIF